MSGAIVTWEMGVGTKFSMHESGGVLKRFALKVNKKLQKVLKGSVS